MARSSPPRPAPAATPQPAPPHRPDAGRDADDPPRGAESPNQTDEMRSGGALPPAPAEGEPPDNRTGLQRPAGGTPNVPRP